MKISSLPLAAAVAAVLGGFSIPAVQAQDNPYYAHGDLVLFFQNPGGTVGADQTLFVSLGNTASSIPGDFSFRGAGAGIEAGQPSFTLVNIESALIAAFGANWATETTLYAGAAGVWGTANSSFNNTLQNGDPNRTTYVSRSRNAAGLGLLGVMGSTAWTLANDTAATTAGSNIQGSFGGFDTLSMSAIAQLSTGVTTLDNNAPAGAANFGGAFVAPGVQQQGTSSSLGSFGGVSEIEFALDLYRILAKTNAPSQVGGGLLTGSYEGTIVLSNDGNVSFIGQTAVPEPSAALLLCGGLGLVGFMRRRRAFAKND